MKNNPAMKKFLSKQKADTLTQRTDECEWFLMIIKWSTRDWEVVISKDSQKISDHTALLDDEANFEKPGPFYNQNATKIKGIIPRPKIHKLNAGKINGPQRKTIVSLFNIPEENARRLKITNLDE